MRTMLLSMRNPRDVTGRAFSHAPDSLKVRSGKIRQDMTR